jgi:signal transduction histidine kinase
MNVRAKLFPAVIAACVALLAIVACVQYVRASRAAEDSLRDETVWRAARLARALEAELREREDDLARLAAAPAWSDIQRAPSSAGREQMHTTDDARVSDDVRARVGAFFAKEHGLCGALTLFNVANAHPLMRFEPSATTRDAGSRATDDAGVRVVASDLLPSRVELGEQKSSHDAARVSASVAPSGVVLLVAPVASGEDENGANRIALVAELKADALASRAADGLADAGDGIPRQALVLARDGRVLFHTNAALKFQNAGSAMPYFSAVAAEMTAGRRGAKLFDGADGARWLAAYEPVSDLDLSVAVASNESAAMTDVRRVGLILAALSVALALAAIALVVAREVSARRGIERIARAAQAVAAGDMDARIEVGEHDRARVIADSFNLMTDRLRALVRREAEGRQFQAFIRLSAMLTHDLKNSITGLSMLVSNMERQFHREEFRADAIASLRDATDKLRGIVARLSKPVETLSGEFRSALKPVDLSALIRRTVEATAKQSQFHEIDLRLPGALEALVDEERIERVVENLVINALEAMGTKPGTLTIEAGREDDGRIFITVADTGVGMSDEYVRAKLFHAFATTKKQGLGLGLYTCREVVEAHGGRITVESKQGSGTRFRVVLPSRPVSLPRAANESSK